MSKTALNNNKINYIDIYGDDSQNVSSMEFSKEDRRKLSAISSGSRNGSDGSLKTTNVKNISSGDSVITARTEDSYYFNTPVTSQRDTTNSSKKNVPPSNDIIQQTKVFPNKAITNITNSNSQGKKTNRQSYLSLAISNAMTPIISSNSSVGPAAAAATSVKYTMNNNDIFRYARDGNASAILQYLNSGFKVDSPDATNQGYTSLLYACENGHYVIVRLLLDKNANINLRSTAGRNPIIVALYNHPQHTDLLHLLIERKADFYAIDNISGYSAFSYACHEGYYDIVKFMLSQSPSPPSEDSASAGFFYACLNSFFDVATVVLESCQHLKLKEEELYIAITYALQKGHIEIFNLLIMKGIELNAVDKFNQATMLHYACQNGQINIVQKLVEKGANVNLLTKDGCSPVYYACEKGHYELVKYLMDAAKADVKTLTRDNNTTLHQACKQGLFDLVAVLMNNGVDIFQVNNNKSTALHYAAESSDTGIVKLLLDYGAKVNILDKDGASPLHYACKNGHLNNVKAMLARLDVQVNIADNSLNTPIAYACEGGYTEIAKEMISHGALPNVLSKDGRTPIYTAVLKGHIDMVKLLCKSGTDLGYMDRQGQSLLHVACKKSDVNMMKLLLENGIDIHARNKNLQTVLHLACDSDQCAVVELLYQYKVDDLLKDEDGCTPLHYASRKGFKDIMLVILTKSRHRASSTMYYMQYALGWAERRLGISQSQSKDV